MPILLQLILETAFKVVLPYLSPAIFIIASFAVADKLIDLIKSPLDKVRRRR